VDRRPRQWKGERYRHERIRVAYLSADFREHAVAYCTAELFGFTIAPGSRCSACLSAPTTAADARALVKAFDRFVDVRPDDAQVAAC